MDGGVVARSTHFHTPNSLLTTGTGSCKRSAKVGKALNGSLFGQRTRVPKIHKCCAAGGKQEVTEKSKLDVAAEEYLVGVEAGLSPDDIVKSQLGIKSNEPMTDKQRDYLEKAKTRIAERAQAILEERKSAENRNLKAGKYAYSKGEYELSVKALEKAVDECGQLSAEGGEAALWLALAYQATGREKECIALYKDLKERHVSKAIRKQAADLLYIMEAPKLKLDKDEKVEVPVMEAADRWSSRGSIGQRAGGRPGKLKKKVKKSLEDEFWENYRPPINVPNRYVWIASSILAAGLAWYSAVGGGSFM